MDGKPESSDGDDSNKQLKIYVDRSLTTTETFNLRFEAPAGLSFCNLQPSLELGNGYEIVKPNYTLAVYEKQDFQNDARSRQVRHMPRKSWKVARYSTLAGFKTPLTERKLRTAASTNNVEMVRKLVANGINPNCCDEQKRSPLHLASCRGYADVVRVLLEHGADPNQRDVLGNTPLHLAACTNNIEVVTLLLKAGTNVNSNDYSGRNPLQLAHSKLKLLHQTKSSGEETKQLKDEINQVIEMLQIYLHKQGQVSEAQLLDEFTSRLTLSETSEQVETDVRDLLASLGNLDLGKP